MRAYVYRGRVARVVDGDTVLFDVDLGFGLWLHDQSFRLRGLNAREHSMPGGREAADNLARVLPVGALVGLQSVKPDKYGGRYDARIELDDGTDLVAQLIADGWAAPWTGTGVKPVPPWPRTEG